MLRRWGIIGSREVLKNVSEDPRSPGDNTGLQGVLALPEFRKLWLGQIFSQLADKFYIVLMVFLIAQYWAGATPPEGGALVEAAGAFNLSIEGRAQWITLLATGIYVANTIPAMVLGLVAGVWADRWRKRDGSLMGPESVWLRLLQLLELWCREHLSRSARSWRMLRQCFDDGASSVAGRS